MDDGAARCAGCSAFGRPVLNAIVFDGVDLAHGARPVLTNVDLSIRAGEFVGLLGPNGAGKTTLLRAILGLVRPDRGSIGLFGEPAKRGCRSIGYLPQTRAHANAGALSGRDTIESVAGGWRWGLPFISASQRRNVDTALAAVGATELAERPLGKLSGGERQRLLLSQALLGDPKILLLDEPLAGLDPAHQVATVELVKRLQREFGLTVLFSAHDLNPLIGAVDRVLYLGGGNAVLGPVDDVVTGPVLSRLYRTPVEVIERGGRRFVVSGAIPSGVSADGTIDAALGGVDCGAPCNAIGAPVFEGLASHIPVQAQENAFAAVRR